MARYDVIVIGCSMGGLSALEKLIPALPPSFNIPIVVVQHIAPDADNYQVTFLDEKSSLVVKEVEEKEPIKPGTVYIAPPNFHVLLEQDASFTLTVDEKVNFSRPSIDVLFETAAECCKERTVGIILTGGNNDGARGLQKISRYGGLAIVQDPQDAEVDIMPLNALRLTKSAKRFYLKDLPSFLKSLM
jgi:two-component system chemotaxis response regulator CheB